MGDVDRRATQKMAFGNSVNTLLDIYSNCISLLKAFKRRDGSGTSRQEKHEAQLRKSLKEDRAKVRRAYSSAVSERGSRFEHGDDRSRSALSRVLKRLKAAITNLLRSSSNYEQATLDYESLMLLSNASRAETIRTIEQLSRRLGSSTSVGSSKSSSNKRRQEPSSSSTARSQTGSSSSSRKERLPNTPKSPPPPSKERTVKPDNGIMQHKRAKHHQKARMKTEDTRTSSRTPSPAREHQTLRRVPNRLSFASIATDSTRLGEIPERKWTSRKMVTSSPSSDASTHYNVKPVYPLKLYEEPVKERTFLGLFRRKT